MRRFFEYYDDLLKELRKRNKQLMNESNLVFEGLQLMLVGMGMVFVFLSVLVICTSFMQKVFKEEKKVLSSQATSLVSEEEVAVISAAVHHYRSNNS